MVYIGKGWIQLNMVKMSPESTLREYQDLNHGIRGVPVALERGQDGKVRAVGSESSLQESLEQELKTA